MAANLGYGAMSTLKRWALNTCGSKHTSASVMLSPQFAQRFAGKVGYALFPSGPGGSGTTIAARSLAIARRLKLMPAYQSRNRGG